jgi:hypothetical protein
MSGSAGNTASSASEKPGRKDVVLTLTVAARMLPLVKGIVADILHNQETLLSLQPEQDRLDRQRRTLSWPERLRRYEVNEDVARAERELEQAIGELDKLGVILVDIWEGQIGFPTLVNGRRACFSWKPGEETLVYWHFEGESTRRPIPPSWSKMTNVRLRSKKP